MNAIWGLKLVARCASSCGISIGHERRREEGTSLHHCLVGWLVGWFVCLLVFKKFIENFFLAKFSLFLKFWRKTWKHLFISVFYPKKKNNGKGVLLLSVKL